MRLIFLTSILTFSLVATNCQEQLTENQEKEIIGIQDNKESEVDFSPLGKLDGGPSNCTQERAEVYFGPNFDLNVEFEYDNCPHPRYTAEFEFYAETNPTDLRTLDIQNDGWLIVNMKKTKYLGPLAAGVYLSEGFHINTPATLTSFYSYFETLPAHCKLIESFGSEQRQWDSSYFLDQRPRVLEIINTDRKKIPPRKKGLSKIEVSERSELVTEIFKHNLSCGPERKHYWDKDYLVYSIEDDVIRFSTIKIFRK